MKKNNSHKKALSIIEIMVGIFIFTLGISAVYMVISSTSRINTYNKNQIIASNLAREQIELIRNIRDTNYARLQKWNTLRPLSWNYTDVLTGSTDFYRLELDLWVWFWSWTILASTEPEVVEFKASLKSISDTDEDIYRLCLNSENQYIYCVNSLWNAVINTKKTPFYRYIEIKQLYDDIAETNAVNNALKIRSRVFWNEKWIYDIEITTILADWKRL